MTTHARPALPKAADGVLRYLSAASIPPKLHTGALSWSVRRIQGSMDGRYLGPCRRSGRRRGLLFSLASNVLLKMLALGCKLFFMASYTTRQAEYRIYLRSPRWRLLRWLRKVIDLGFCRDCLRHGHITRRGLQAHHLRYDNKGESFIGELLDLRMLCDACHAKRHGKES